MVGLNKAKEIINNAIDAYKVRGMYYSKGYKQDSASMHMVFTGNPGTAKTTVARLFSRILYENEVIPVGHIVEVGRGDLVGKYVGWTAKIVKEKFKEAKGGVLFIDEAYSLVDDRDGMYGDEAINTIVQEMENQRENVIVIFAGYPDKMEKFLDKNPGLRSRIAFHVHFDDYSTEDLLNIADIMAEDMGLKIVPDAKNKLRDIFNEAIQQKDYGNGRFVRNMLEKARLKQASRLIKLDYNKVSADDVKQILPEDIYEPEYKPKMRRVIGF